MTQAYSDPERETEPHALPNIEIFHMSADELADSAIENGEDVAHDVAAENGQMFENVKHMAWFRKAVAEECEPGFFWWSCFPGCLPDGEPFGPFETEAEALADARDY